MDVKWGTRTPIQLEDPQYHLMLPIRAYGQYGIQIDDSVKFLLKLVGTLPYFRESDLANYFRGIVLTYAKDYISKFIVEKNISILKISASLRNLSENIEEMLIQECAKFGVRITNFNIESLTTDENDPAVKKLRNALAEKAEMDIIGYSYQQKRTFDTMQTAAGNEGNSGIMNAGIGMGMGIGFGVPAGNIMANMGSQLEIESRNPSSQAIRPVTPAVSETACQKCGTALSGNLLFCPQCGKKLNKCTACNCDNPENILNCIKCGHAMPVICPNCGNATPGGNKFCSKCGRQIIPTCEQCGAEVTNDTIFCPKCGKKLQ